MRALKKILAGSLVALAVAPLWCTDKPYFFRAQDRWTLPILETNVFSRVDYKTLATKPGNFGVFAPIPHDPNRSDLDETSPPPNRPSFLHWFGTDDRGRDLLARVIYGARHSLFFAVISWAAIVLLALLFALPQGFFGGRIDFWGQRLTETWSHLPGLYVLLLTSSLFPGAWALSWGIWLVFQWMPVAALLRAEVLRLAQLDFILAARSQGLSFLRLSATHLIPHALLPIRTLTPMGIANQMAALTALDFLGLGLPPPMASLGELFRQAKENLDCWWLGVFPALVLVLFLWAMYQVGRSRQATFISAK